MTNSNAKHVFIDDGYAQIKALLDLNHSTVFPSSVIQTDQFQTSGSGEVIGGLYETDGKRYKVNDDANAKQTAYDGYHYSTENRILNHAAINELGLLGHDIVLHVGVPYSDYFNYEGTLRKELLSKKIANLKENPVYFYDGKNMVSSKITTVVINPQAYMSYGDIGFTDDFQPIAGRSDCYIIDIGGRTTDMVHIQNGGRTVNHETSRNINLGVLNVAQVLRPMLADEFGVTEARIPENVAKKFLLERRISMMGKEYRNDALVDKAIETIGSKLLHEIQMTMDSVAFSIENIAFVGGGSLLYKKFLIKAMENAIFSENPEMANVRGAYKIFQLSQA